MRTPLERLNLSYKGVLLFYKDLYLKEVKMQIKQEILDELAELEVEALLDGLHDEELRRTPAFLEKVRKFLKDNQLQTTPELVVAIPKEEIKEIPIFDDVD